MYGTWTSPGRGPTGECSGQPTPVVLREHLSERDPSGRCGWRPARAHHVPGLLRIAPLSPSRVPPVLLTTAIGFGLGQLWAYLGLPSLNLGQANVLPAVIFALLLQPLVRFVPRPRREPKEPAEKPPTS